MYLKAICHFSKSRDNIIFYNKNNKIKQYIFINIYTFYYKKSKHLKTVY